MDKNEVEKVCGMDRDHLEEGKGGNKGWGCRLPGLLPRRGNQTSSSEWGRQRTVSHSWGAEVGVGRAGSLTAWLRHWMNHTYRLISCQIKWRSELQQSETFRLCSGKSYKWMEVSRHKKSPRGSVASGYPPFQVHPPRASHSAWGEVRDLPDTAYGAKRTFPDNKK